jgi:hypothetical protein
MDDRFIILGREEEMGENGQSVLSLHDTLDFL